MAAFSLLFSVFAQRWYATEEAARAFNLTEELEGILNRIKTEEKILEARNQELAEQLKAQLVANNAILDTDDKKQHPHAVTSPNDTTTTATTARTSVTPAARASPAAAATPATAGPSCSKLEVAFAKRVEASDEPQHATAQDFSGNNTVAAAAAELRQSSSVQQLLQQKRPLSSCGDSVSLPADKDTAVSVAAGHANSQGTPLTAHVTAAALLPEKLAGEQAELREGYGASPPSGSGIAAVAVVPVQQGLRGPRQSAPSAVSAYLTGCPGTVSSKFVSPPMVAPRHSADGMVACERPGAPVLGVQPARVEEDLDKIAAGKRMRKSAVLQGTPVDMPVDAAPKRVKRRQSALRNP